MKRAHFDLDPWAEGVLGGWSRVAEAGQGAEEWRSQTGPDSKVLVGSFQERWLRDEVWMHWSDLRLAGDVCMPPYCGEGWIVFQFTLSGAWRHQVRSPARRDYGQVAGQMGLLHDRWDSRPSWIGSEAFVHLTAAMTEAAFQAWLGEPDNDEPAGLQRARAFLRQNDIAGMHTALTPRAESLVREIIACPLTGRLRTLFMEARFHDLGLELLCALGGEKDPCARRMRCLQRSDQDRIQAAAERLCRDLDRPPTLLELARLVGMSESKLKRDFQTLLGQAPYAYLRQKRMQRAHEMLSSGTHTILDVASSVGYENPSNFAASFRAVYGLNPRDFLRQLRG